MGLTVSVGDKAEDVECGVREFDCSIDRVDWTSSTVVVSDKLGRDVSSEGVCVSIPSVEVVIGNTVVENSKVVEMVSEAGIGSAPVVSVSIGDSVVEELSFVAVSVSTVEVSNVDDSSVVVPNVDVAVGLWSNVWVVPSVKTTPDVSVLDS